MTIDLFTSDDEKAREEQRTKLKDLGWWPSFSGRYGWRSPDGEIMTEQEAFVKVFRSDAMPPAVPAETQATVSNWTRATFPGADPKSPRLALRALEECVELCLASGASMMDVQIAVARVAGAVGLNFSDINRQDRKPANIPADAADVQIVLWSLAGLYGFDLSAAVTDKMQINRQRQWRSWGDGTGYRIKST